MQKLNIQIESYRLSLLMRSVMACLFTMLIVGCASSTVESEAIEKAKVRVSADQLMPVDCLLPPQIRRLGRKAAYATRRRAIKTTDLDCQIRGGEYVAYDRADYRTSLEVWLEKAQQGDAEAQSYVGEIYEKGLGLPSDYKTAHAWYLKAAEQGYSRAMINLGYLYEKGLGVEQNSIIALNWYRKASGITDNDIDYTSAIEVKAATLAQEQNELLRQEIRRRTREIEALKSSLSSVQQKVNRYQQELQDSRQKMDRLKKQMDSTSDSTGFNDLKRDYKVQVQKVAQLERKLSEFVTKRDREQRILERKASYVSQQNRLLDTKEIPGPSIELFDPVIVITRSGDTKVRVRSGSNARVISGRFNAPAGLKTASLNGRPITTDSNGLFNSAVTITKKEKKVVIEVLDQSEKSAQLSFTMVPEQGLVKPTIDTDQSNINSNTLRFGRYYALVIGNDEYIHYQQLKTAINDAKNVAKLLREKYGFNTRFIRNADRYTILSAINEVKGKLTDEDNLLIYFAGHGERDVKLQGYWLPVDAEQENTANWIPNSAISDLLNTMPAKHILVVADSCYSGSMTSSSVARLDTQLSDEHLTKWLKVMAKTPSRTVLTSGGIAPVLDSVGGANSLFAKAFIDELERAKGLIDAYKIYLKVSQRVKKNAADLGFDQTPTYAPIKFTGHSGGEFIFIKS